MQIEAPTCRWKGRASPVNLSRASSRRELGAGCHPRRGEAGREGEDWCRGATLEVGVRGGGGEGGRSGQGK